MIPNKDLTYIIKTLIWHIEYAQKENQVIPIKDCFLYNYLGYQKYYYYGFEMRDNKLRGKVAGYHQMKFENDEELYKGYQFFYVEIDGIKHYLILIDDELKFISESNTTHHKPFLSMKDLWYYCQNKERRDNIESLLEN